MFDQALDHISVLDLSTTVGGAYCTKLLAEYGAHVLKVEPPYAGDPIRRESPFLKDLPYPETSGLSLYLNTGKRSITLDVSQVAGRRLFLELVKGADLVLESFPAGTMGELGLAYETLEEVNPTIVVTSISNFGQTGPYRDYQSSEIVEYAFSGQMFIIGLPDREPLKPGGFQAQYQAGLSASIASLGALYETGFSGRGQHLDISILDTVMSALESVILTHEYAGGVRERAGNRYGMWAPRVDIFPCADGYLVLALNTDDEWEKFCQFMGRPDLLEDPRYADRLEPEHVEPLADILREWFLERKAMDVFVEAHDWRVPIGLVPNIKELLEDPHYNARGFWVDVEHPDAGLFKHPGTAVKLSETPGQIARAPRLGEHNETVYRGILGFSQHEISRLRQSGII